MVVWSPLSDISFSELADVKGLRRGLYAHLVALRATGLLRVLEHCMRKYLEELPSGDGSKHKRRRVNNDVTQLTNATEHIDAPGSNALGQSAAPMQPLASTAFDPTPFPHALASSNVRPQVAPLLPGDLAGAELAVCFALVAMQVAAKAGDAIRGGRAICPRTGLLLAPPLNQQQASRPKTSKVLLDLIGKELPASWAGALGLSKGKNCGVWIAPWQDVCAATGSVFSLGMVCQIVNVDAGQSELTVAPGLPWSREGIPTRVITLTLQDLHEYFFIHGALLRARNRGGDEAPLKMFWGIAPPGGAGSSGDLSASAISSIFAGV